MTPQEARRRMIERGRRPGKAPRWQTPDSIEREYMRELEGIADEINKEIEQNLLPIIGDLVASRDRDRGDARTDEGWAEQLREIMDRTEVAVFRRLDQRRLRRLARDYGERTGKFNKRQATRLAEAVFGVDVTLDEPWLKDKLEAFGNQNASLIKDVGEQQVNQVSRIANQALLEGKTNQAIVADIQKRLDIGKRRARLIARDQVASLNANLTKERQGSLGLRRYRWRNSDDERVRGNPDGRYPDAVPSHWDREGKIFSWDSPPSDGHPGEPILCRCWAEAVLEDIDPDQ